VAARVCSRGVGEKSGCVLAARDGTIWPGMRLNDMVTLPPPPEEDDDEAEDGARLRRAPPMTLLGCLLCRRDGSAGNMGLCGTPGPYRVGEGEGKGRG
jgi:hypothetical protein